MSSYTAAILALALLCLPGGVHAAQPDGGQERRQQPRDSRQQDPNRWKWWINPDDRRELGITDQQSAAIDQIFESTMPAHRAKWREFERLEESLARTLKENTADVKRVAQEVEKVERMRAELATTRTLMLYRINLVLTPEQRVKVDQIRAKREQERHRQPDRPK